MEPGTVRLVTRLTFAWLCAATIALPVVSAADVDYASQIKSVFKHRCYACHGALKQEAGLRLDSGQLIRKGSENGVIVQKAAVEASVSVSYTHLTLPTKA